MQRAGSNSTLMEGAEQCDSPRIESVKIRARNGTEKDFASALVIGKCLGSHFTIFHCLLTSIYLDCTEGTSFGYKWLQRNSAVPSLDGAISNLRVDTNQCYITFWMFIPTHHRKSFPIPKAYDEATWLFTNLSWTEVLLNSGLQQNVIVRTHPVSGPTSLQSAIQSCT